MKQEDLEKITSGIQTKLGQEASALITDDLATILLDNNSMNTELENRQTIINTLKDDKDKLIMTNNRLFQQVGLGEEPSSNKEEDNSSAKPFSFKSVFDEKGNFIN